MPKPVFRHRQMYVAISRVISKKGLKILILNEDAKETNKTINIVYKEIFSNLGSILFFMIYLSINSFINAFAF